MRGWKKRPELREQAISLRLAERLSNREIHQRLGGAVNLSSVTRWLKDHPLAQDEQEAKRRAGFARSCPYTPPSEPSALWRSVDFRNLDRASKGRVAETAFTLRCLTRGMSIFASPHDGERIDRVVRTTTGKLWTVQVRLCKRNTEGAPIISLKRNRGARFVTGDFDILVGFDAYEDAVFIYTWTELEHLSACIAVSNDAREAWHKLLV